MKRLWKGITLAVAAFLMLPSLLALAYAWYIDFTVTESLGTAYTSLPIGAPAANAYYATNGYISATGLNTRVYDSANSTMPHMLTEDTTWFVGAQPASNTQVFRYALGDTALSAFKIIPGYSGNITTSDNANLELGSVFDISISGYFDTSAGSDKNILFKDEAAKLDVSAASTITFHALNADNSDNWTMSYNALSSGEHTIRVYGDGINAYLYTDGSFRDSQSLVTYYNYNIADVANSSAVSARQMPVYSYYSQDRTWLFYEDTDNIWFTSSDDYGATWAAASQLTVDNATTSIQNFSIAYNGTYLVYARYKSTGSVTYWCRGEPQSDGTINWTAEQTVDSGVASLPYCAISSTGVYWVSLSGGTYLGTVIKSNTQVDGTWVTASTTTLNAGTTKHSIIVPLATGGKMYVIHRTGTVDGVIYGRYYNGAAWAGSDETIEATTNYYGLRVWAVTDTSDNLLIMYNPSDSTYEVVKQRDSTGSIGVVTSFTTVSTQSPMLSYSPAIDTYFMFYVPSSTSLVYKTIKDGTVSGENTVASPLVWDASSSFCDGYLWDADATIGVYNIRWTGATFNLQYATIGFSWSWLDNANNWNWMAGNSMSYADNMTMAVSGVQKLLYLPDSMISGTTLPDESGNGNDGAFNWGTNPVGVTVASGPLVGGTPPHTPTAPTSPWELVPTVPAAPADLFTEGGECMPGLAELADASEATGNPRAMFPIMLAFGLAILAGFGVYGATHNSRAGQRGSIFLQSVTSLAVLIFFYVGGCGVIPGWVLIPFGLEAVFLLVGRNPQHSST